MKKVATASSVMRNEKEDSVDRIADDYVWKITFECMTLELIKGISNCKAQIDETG